MSTYRVATVSYRRVLKMKNKIVDALIIAAGSISAAIYITIAGAALYSYIAPPSDSIDCSNGCDITDVY